MREAVSGSDVAIERQRRKANQAITIRDVAAHAGVSPMTVSRVINREPSVKGSTRERVHAAIRELNYAPSAAARSLAGSAPCRVGLLYDNPSMGYLSEVLIGVLDEGRRTGAQVLVEHCGDAQLPEETLRKMLQGGADGLVLLPPLCESTVVLGQVREAGAAVVALAPAEPSEQVATVRIDNFAASREMTEYLLGLGHRRFGFIQGHPSHAVSVQRLHGFLAALADAGIGRDSVRLAQGYFSYRSGLMAAEQLLDVEPLPTAIFAANDDMAAATASLAHRLGFDVPQDLSIVGFDDTPLAASVWPALTTIRQPVAAMARTAVDLLLDEVRRLRDGTGQPGQSLHAHSLIVRESSGPPQQP